MLEKEQLQNIQGRIGIACAEDAQLLAMFEDATLSYEQLYVFGNKEIIQELLPKQVSRVTIVDCESAQAACEQACAFAAKGQVDVVMKGLVDTSIFLKAVLAKLKTPQRLSHVTRFHAEHYHKPFLVSDCAMNIAPDVSTFVNIIASAVDAAKRLGVSTPRVALLAAKEKVDAKMPITQIYQEVIAQTEHLDAIIEGPLALDNALSYESAKIKKITSRVCGDADILIMPDIESGNIFYKTMNLFASTSCAGVIVGASVPVVVTSRADSIANRVDSLALALALAKRV
ncbi:MAG: phosphate acyltransferase [Erysipelotrichaceae bacterium]